MNNYCDNCQADLARIHGRTLKQALECTKANHGFGKITSTQWIDICPICDAYTLGMETTHPWPFLCADGVMRTAKDFDHTTRQSEAKSLDFYGLGLTRSALDSAIELAQQEFEETRRLEKDGATFLRGSPTMSSPRFNEAVCK
nr:hypothetical protein [uncultured Halomonas sp.]